MKRFYSAKKTSNITSTATPNPPPPTKKNKNKNKNNKKWKYSFISKLQKIVAKNVQNMKPVHIAQVSFHILHIFAQFLYFAHFSKQRPFGVNLLQNINKSQQAEKKINNDRRKEKYGWLSQWRAC